ncbi:hypothetical protein [Clostridium butyricum]|nr:hypothetical protein [Clostridium butyricum]APF20988.1 hypothetical protein NPD4_3643 [Clostridium butyricum]
MEEEIIKIFKCYGKWLQINNFEDNLDNYIIFMNDICIKNILRNQEENKL